MNRTLILDTNPFHSINFEESHPVLTPNVYAARALGIPYQSLYGQAKNILMENALGVASELSAYRLIQHAVRAEFGDADVHGMAKFFLPSIRAFFKAGIDPEVVKDSQTVRVKQIAQVAVSYRKQLRESNLVDTSEVLWIASRYAASAQQKVGVYGFPRLCKDELAFIDAIAGDGSVVVLPYNNHPAFHENETAAHYLEKQGWKVIKKSSSAVSLGEKISETFIGVHNSPVPIQAYKYPHLEAEVRGILTQVKLLLSEGVSPDSIVIITNNMADYGAAIQSVSWEYEIPIRFQFDITLNETRFGAWILLVFESIRKQLPFEETARLLMHPLGPGLANKTWSESRQRRSSGLEAWQLSGLKLDKLEWPQQDFEKNYEQRLRELLEVFRLRQRTALWAREAIAFYTFLDALNELSLSQNRVTTLDSFIDTIQVTLLLLTVPSSPGRGGVELHQPQSLYGAKYSYVFLAGASEGILPAPIQEDLVLDFHDREHLNQKGIEMESAVDAMLQETLSIWSLLQIVTKSITISYPKLIGRKETLPSKIFESLGCTPYSSPVLPVASFEEIRKYRFTDQKDLEDPCFPYTQHAWNIELSRGKSSSYDEYDGKAGISINPEEREFSASQLISLGQCPFKWYAQHILQLKEEEEAEDELNPTLKGNLCHLALQYAAEKAKDSDDPRVCMLESLEESLRKAEEELHLPFLYAWDAQREEILTLLKHAVESENFFPDDSDILATEERFEGNWYGLKVRGIIDRIDRVPEGLILIDYKTSSTTPPGAKNEEGKTKLDIQLPLYAQAASPNLFPEENVVDAYYYSLPKGKKMKTKTEESKLQEFVESIKTILLEGYYPVCPDLDGNSCRYCPFDFVCRKGVRLSRKRVEV